MEKLAKKGRTPGQWISYLKSKGAPQKLLDQIRKIEQNGKEYGKSKEYIMRTIIDKIPKQYLEEPTKVHGPGKSGPLSEKKKKSSIELDNDSYFNIEQVIKKVARDNEIDNVEEVYIKVSSTEGLVMFKQAEASEESMEALEKLKNVEGEEENIISEKKDMMKDYLSLGKEFMEVEKEEDEALENLEESMEKGDD